MNSLSSGQKYVWIYGHEEHLWSAGQIVGETESHFKAQSVEDGELYDVAKADAIFIPEANLECKQPDLIHLNELDEGTLLRTVRLRYGSQQIYTAIGNSVLIAVNPYERIKRLYSPETQRKYHAEMQRPDFVVEPHLYVIAESAFQEMERTDKNQAIIVSGESGAGKTESTKILLKYLAWVARQGRPAPKGGAKEELKEAAGGGDCGDIEELTLRANPMLEAFGNAKTVRNDNSSRFGKFIEVRFLKGQGLHSAQIVNYLLEKSRIVTQAEDERNFHIFYQLCAGLEAADRAHLGLKEIYDYKFNGLCFNIDGVDDAEEFAATRECFHTLGFSAEQMMEVFELVVAILNMGNVEFEDEYKVSVGDIAQLDGPESKQALDEAARLLRMAPETLEGALKNATKKIGKDTMTMVKTAAQATDARNSICKVVYDRMFSWLIQRVNAAMRGRRGVSEKKVRVVGLLDIFGFEIFEKNSFEQLCINYANEKLQQFFNDVIFHLEQEIYMKEKIQWAHIRVSDNLQCIRMIENNANSLFKLLNDECRMKKSDPGLIKMFFASLSSDYSKNLKKERDDHLFRVEHYAGGVVYDIHGFCEKNIDKVDDSILQSLASSSNPIMQQLFAKQAASASAPASSKAPPKSISVQFKEQLATLMRILSESQPKFVRCIKPNAVKRPQLFESIDVNRQLQYSGVLETVKIRRAGYPVRRDYEEFVQRYQIFLNKKQREWVKEPKAKAREILTSMKTYHKKFQHLADPAQLNWQVGLSKIFMKYEVSEALEVCLGICLRKQITRFQALWRGYKWRRWWKRLKRAVARVKHFWKKYLRYQRFRGWVRATRQQAILLKCKIIRQFRAHRLRARLRRRILLRKAVQRRVAVERTARQQKGLAKLEQNRQYEREQERIRQEAEARRKAEEKQRLAAAKVEADRLQQEQKAEAAKKAREDELRAQAEAYKAQLEREAAARREQEKQDTLAREAELERKRAQEQEQARQKLAAEEHKRKELELKKLAEELERREKALLEREEHRRAGGPPRAHKRGGSYDYEERKAVRGYEERQREDYYDEEEEGDEQEEWRMVRADEKPRQQQKKSERDKRKKKKKAKRGLSEISEESESDEDLYGRELDSSLALLLKNISPDIRREQMLRVEQICKFFQQRDALRAWKQAGAPPVGLGGLGAAGAGGNIWKQWRESKKRADELELLNVKLKAEQEFLAKTIGELKEENQELSTQRGRFQQQMHAESEDLLQLRAELDDRSGELGEEREATRRAKEAARELQGEVENLRMELELQKKESSISVNVASDKLEELQAGLERQKRENEHLRRVAKKHESAATTLAQQVNEMKKQLEYLSEELNHRDNEYKEQKRTADRLELQVKALTQDLERARGGLPLPAEEAPPPPGAPGEKLQGYLNSLKEEVGKLRQENKELSECMGDMSNNLDSANVVNARMREQLEASDFKIQSLKARIHDSKKSFQGIDKVLYSLLLIQRKEISEFRKNYSELFRSSKEFQMFSSNERKLWKALREELAAEGKKKHSGVDAAHLARVTELAKQETLHD